MRCALFCILLFFTNLAYADYKYEDIKQVQPELDYFVDKAGKAVTGFAHKYIGAKLVASMYIENGMPGYITVYTGTDSYKVVNYERGYIDRLKLTIPSIKPVVGWVSSNYGYRTSPITGAREFHQGIDIAANEGNNVFATADGVVAFAGERGGYGLFVKIDHGFGYETAYGHNSKINVKVGDEVKAGDVIALVGSTGRSTGAHVHYEVLIDGTSVNPASYF